MKRKVFTLAVICASALTVFGCSDSEEPNNNSYNGTNGYVEVATGTNNQSAVNDENRVTEEKTEKETEPESTTKEREPETEPELYRINDNRIMYNVDGILTQAIVKQAEKEYMNKGGTVYIAEFGTKVKEIEAGAFSGDKMIGAMLTIPGNVETIGDAAFKDCTNLTGVTLEEGVKTVGSQVFEKCSGIRKATVPGSLEIIGDYMFRDCIALNEVSITEGLVRIGDYAFLNTAIEDISFPSTLTSVGKSALDNTPVYNTKTKNDSYRAIDNVLLKISLVNDDVVIPEGITIIADGACSSNSGKKNTLMTLPESLVYIGKEAFCKGDSNFGDEFDIKRIPSGVKYIGDNAFAGVEIKEKVVLSKDMTIGEQAFKAARFLDGIVFEAGITEIGEKCFAGSRISELILPEGVVSIGNEAFYDCGIQKLVLPDSVCSIGSRAFYGNSFTEVNIPKGLTTISEGAFERCTLLTQVIIPENVESIGKEAFRSCEALENVTLNDSIKSIGEGAFIYCDKLKELVISESTTEIGKDAFAGCNKLVIKCKAGSYAETYALGNGIYYEIN